jgi:hypothetical protein
MKVFDVRKLVAVVLVVLLVGLMVGAERFGGVVQARSVTPWAECQSGHACGGMLETGSVAHRQHYARVVAPLAECQSGCACGG